MAKSRIKWPSLAVALAVVAMSTLNANAIVIATPGDTYDTWINPGAAGIHYAADGLSTTASGSSFGERYGVAMFDLSSIASTPVTNVRLQLSSAGQLINGPLTIVSTYVTSSIGAAYPADLTTFDGVYYTTNIQPVESSFSTLGSEVFDGNGDPPDETYGEVGVSSAADVAVFNAARLLATPSIMIIYKATDGARDWADTGYHAAPPLIIINEPIAAPPPFGDIDKDYDIDLVDYGIMTDPSHWLKGVTPNTNGDLNGSGFVDLLDFALFKPAYTTFNGGSGGSLSAPVPEPSTLVLLAVALPAWLLCRRKRAPRCA